MNGEYWRGEIQIRSPPGGSGGLFQFAQGHVFHIVVGDEVRALLCRNIEEDKGVGIGQIRQC